MGKSAIITFLSPKGTNTSEETYMVEGRDWKVTGKETNDAPVKYLLERAKEDGEISSQPVDMIVCIVSKKVYDNGKEDSVYVLFQKMVKDYMRTDTIQFNMVLYDFAIGANGELKDLDTQQEKTVSVYRGIENALAGYENVYIDYTGGFRDISFFTTVLIRYLEFIHIHCKDIVYSKKDGNKRNIYSLLYIYDLFRLLNAVSQFIETGSGKLLKDIYGDSIKNEPTRKLVNCIQKFSSVIQLCNVQEVDQIFGEMQEAICGLEKYQKSEMEHGTEKDADIQVLMFRELLPVIREKFYMEGENIPLAYPRLIRWCVDNDLLQQAMTLYVEKMPVVYYENRFLNKESCEDEGEKVLSEAEQFYQDFYAWVARDDKDPLLAFRKELEKIQLWQKENPGFDYIQNIKKVRQACRDETIRRALDKLNDILNKYYKGNNYKKVGDGDIVQCGVKITQTSAQSLINHLLHSPDLCYAFLLDNEQELEEKREYEKNIKEGGTYKKKIMALDRLSQLEDDAIPTYTEKLSKKELYDMMLYYLAVKYLRNHINHAAEEGQDNDKDEEEDKKREDEKILRQFMDKKGIKMELTPDNVRTILLNGWKITGPY